MFVNYHCKIRERTIHYPIFKVPTEGTIIRSHRYGKTNRRGFTEEDFQKKLEQKFSGSFEVSGNVRINRGSDIEPYEPDIALISKTDINIRIDIEIDEPYAGIDRQPTHYIGEDDFRNAFFKDRGWIVIRFSELQVHKYPSECLRYLASVFNSLDPKIKVAELLHTQRQLDEQPLWSYDQCKLWERVNYREKYLNHEFNFLSESSQNEDADLNEMEIVEEQLVKNHLCTRKEAKTTKSSNKSEKKTEIIHYHTPQEKKEAISQAIKTSKNIQFKYQKSISFDNGKRSIRTIKPEVFEEYPNSLCIKGYCYGRKADREFSLDRISGLLIDPEKITHWEEDNYDGY